MRQKLQDFSGRNAIYIVLFILIISIGALNSNFLSLTNIINVLRISSIRVLIALGVGGILITRGTDLSAGRVVGLTAVISASLIQRGDYSNRMYQFLPELPIIIPILVAILVGLLIGLLNGVIVAFLSVPAFITTLGTMVIVYGASSIYVDRPPQGAQPIGGLHENFTQIGTGFIGISNNVSLPYLVIIAAIIICLVWVLLNKTPFGKNIYAIGGNPEAALVSGVNVKKNLVGVYALGGALYGLAGALLAARTGGATNNYGLMYELDAIAACVIGGVSTNGGIGTIGGMLVGVLIFEVLNNGLVILDVSAYWQQIIKGVIIIVAVAWDIRKYLNKR